MDVPIAKKNLTVDISRARKPSLVLSKTNLKEVRARKQSANLLQLQQLQRLNLQPQHPLLSIRPDQVIIDRLINLTLSLPLSLSLSV